MPTILIFLSFILLLIAISLVSRFYYVQLKHVQNNLKLEKNEVLIELKNRRNLVHKLYFFLKKECTAFDSELLDKIELEKNQTGAIKNVCPEKIKIEKEISQNLEDLLLASKKFEELKNNQEFLEQKTKIQKLESSLYQKINNYNQALSHYYVFIEDFPYRFFQKFFAAQCPKIDWLESNYDHKEK